MSNPYLQGQANAITSTVTDNLRNNILPGINQSAIANGAYGGSRHGVMQGLAIGQTNLGLGNALANLYGNAYESDQNRTLAQNQFNTNTDRQAAMDNFQRQLASAQFQQQAMGNQMNWQNMALGWANQQQQTPLNNLAQLANLGMGLGGMGGSSSTPYQGNPLLGAVGGAQLGSSLWNLFNKPGG